MNITELTADDWEKLRGITLEATKLEPQAFASAYEKNLEYPEEKWRGWLAPFSETVGSLTLFALNDDTKPIGKITALLFSPESIELVGMFVSPTVRGQGISKLLLKELLERITKVVHGRKIILDVNSEQTVAINLYKKFNFQETGRESMVLADGKEHEVIKMELISTP